MSRKNIIVVIVLAVIAVFSGLAYINQHQNSAPRKQSSSSLNSTAKADTKSTINLVALGDSLTQGVGDQDKNGGYVGLISKKISDNMNVKVNKSNYGVSGDRSDQILNRLDHNQKFQNKIKSADVIVMTVGGNDLLQILQKVALASSTSKVKTSLDNGSKTYDKKLNSLLTAVRKYNPNAPIFLFSVYNPFYVYFAHVSTLTNSVHQWNETSKSTLSNYGPAYFVDVDDLMSHGQYTTKAQQAKLVKEDEATNNQSSLSQKTTTKIMDQSGKNLNKYISTDDNFHPNHLGYQKMTDELFTSMKIHNDWLYK